MKRIVCSFLCMSIAFMSFSEIPAVGLPHVVIAGFTNSTGDETFDTPAATATESLALTIRMLGAYRIVVPETAVPELTDGELLPWCERESVDYVLYGSIDAAKRDNQKYSLALFDREKGKVTIRENAKGSSIFDVFSCTDTLTFAVIDAIAGRHVGFGSIAFEVTNPGEEGALIVSLNGTEVAQNLSPIDRVVEGRHLVSVTWRAEGADPKEIALVEVEIAEGECTTVPVTIPMKAKNTNVASETHGTGSGKGMVFVEGGTFTMGSDTGPRNEQPAHEVAVKSFWMSKTEVTQGEFKELEGYLPINSNRNFSQKKYGEEYPVILIYWISALWYCNNRSLQEGLTPVYRIQGETVSWDRLANGYRLPTEAEWEYAARGGANHDAFIYPGSDDAREVAVTSKTAGGNGFALVGSRKPNSLGIFDLGGNVYEWCWDIYDSYRNTERTALIEEKSNKSRVVRGGDSMHGNKDARCTARTFTYQSLVNEINNGFVDTSRNIGFRVVRSVIDE